MIFDPIEVHKKTPEMITAFIVDSCETCGYKKREMHRSALNYFFKAALKCADEWVLVVLSAIYLILTMQKVMQGLKRKKDTGRFLERSLSVLYRHMVKLGEVGCNYNSLRSNLFDTLWKVCFFCMFPIDDALNLRLRDVKYSLSSG